MSGNKKGFKCQGLYSVLMGRRETFQNITLYNTMTHDKYFSHINWMTRLATGLSASYHTDRILALRHTNTNLSDCHKQINLKNVIISPQLRGIT